jgi:NADP-dependent 3-hydroxy acid dehydrogenase YdfG
VTNFFDAGGGPPDRAMMSADQIANAIMFAINQPHGVDVNTMTIRPQPSPL